MLNRNAKGEIVAEAIWKSVNYSNSNNNNTNKIAANQKLHECCKQGKAATATAAEAAIATATEAAATNEKWALWVDGWLSQGYT